MWLEFQRLSLRLGRIRRTVKKKCVCLCKCVCVFWSDPSWKSREGGLPSCPSGSRTWSHFTLWTKTPQPWSLRFIFLLFFFFSCDSPPPGDMCAHWMDPVGLLPLIHPDSHFHLFQPNNFAEIFFFLLQKRQEDSKETIKKKKFSQAKNNICTYTKVHAQ